MLCSASAHQKLVDHNHEMKVRNRTTAILLVTTLENLNFHNYETSTVAKLTTHKRPSALFIVFQYTSKCTEIRVGSAERNSRERAAPLSLSDAAHESVQNKPTDSSQHPKCWRWNDWTIKGGNMPFFCRQQVLWPENETSLKCNRLGRKLPCTANRTCWRTRWRLPLCRRQARPLPLRNMDHRLMSSPSMGSPTYMLTFIRGLDWGRSLLCSQLQRDECVIRISILHLRRT